MRMNKKIKPDARKSITVLVVDDSSANLEFVENCLREYGYTTLIATTGEIALKRIDYARPDIILLDVMMPGISGFEMCQKLKSNKRNKEIPVIFMTALNDPEHKSKAFSVGAIDYVTKPIQKEELLARVKTHLKIYKNQIYLEEEVRKRTAEVEDRMTELLNEIEYRKRVEEELRASRDYLEKLTNSMWDIVFSVKMPERVIEWVNDSIRFIGYEPSECVGKDTTFLYRDKDDFLDFGNEIMNAIAAGKDLLHTEQLFKRKTGETFPVEITTTFHKENDEVVRVTSIVRDITEQKQNEAELEKYQKHLETLVKKQTNKLGEKVRELERMNDLFVGREFRIKELRDKVEELEGGKDC